MNTLLSNTVDDEDRQTGGNTGTRSPKDPSLDRGGSQADIGQHTVGSTAVADQKDLPDSTPSRDNDDVRRHATADRDTFDVGPPTKVRRQELCAAETDTATTWRCLGLTPVPSFGVEMRNLLECDAKFRVQQVLQSAAILPRMDVAIARITGASAGALPP